MATLGTIKAHLHVSVGENALVDLAEFDIPLEAHVTGFGIGEVRVTTSDIRENIADALEQAAAQIRPMINQAVNHPSDTYATVHSETVPVVNDR